MMQNIYDSPLLTDLYQLTMLQGYFAQSMEETAVFEFFVRELPDERNFLLAAGLEQVLDYLQNLHFSETDLDYLATTGKFTKEFLDHLGDFRFTGEVWAMPEGTVFFHDEPMLQIIAPLPQAQFIETRIINLLHFQTLIASKAARMRLVAPEHLLVDFGLRRAHGGEAGLLAARASFIAGFDGSSTVLAGQVFGIPIYGTMAHSFIQAHDHEMEAFEHFAQSQPIGVVFLIDTYDTEKAAAKVVALAPRLREKNITIAAVRLDSGDLADHARRVRAILDIGGLSHVKIFSSGNLDEYVLHHLTDLGAPIDGFGIGTRMATAADRPYLDCAYKLEEYAGLPRRKKSEGKETWPGRKQIYRHFGKHGHFDHDLLTLTTEATPSGRPLLQCFMENGKRLGDGTTLTTLKEHARSELAKLPPALRQITKAITPFPVRISPALAQCTRAVDIRTAGP